MGILTLFITRGPACSDLVIRHIHANHNWNLRKRSSIHQNEWQKNSEERSVDVVEAIENQRSAQPHFWDTLLEFQRGGKLSRGLPWQVLKVIGDIYRESEIIYSTTRRFSSKKKAPSIPHSVVFVCLFPDDHCSAPGDTSKNHRTYGVQRWQPATVAAKVLKRVRCFSSASLVTGAMTQPTLRTSFRLLYLDPYTLENTHVPWKNSGWKTTFLLRWQLFRGRSLVFGGVLLLIPVNPHNTLSTFFCTGLQFFSVCLQIIPSVLNGWKRTNKIETEIPGNKKNILKNIGIRKVRYFQSKMLFTKRMWFEPPKKTERKRK